MHVFSSVCVSDVMQDEDFDEDEGIYDELNLDEEEEKFLKGVRICRDCRPVLL